MEKFIIIILAIGLIIFIALYFSLRKNVSDIADRLDSINSTKTNAKILIGSANNLIKKLALAINNGLEEKLKVEAEYKRMDLELRQAIANISHDLRTPLTSIMGYIQLIEDDNLPEEEKKQYIDIVKKRSKALQMLISGFYDLSRLEAKEYKFEFKTLNLYNIICDITASYYNDFLNKGIDPALELEENIKLVISDENAVRRISSNLIQNMLKYSSKNMSVTLSQKDGYISNIFTNDAPDLKEEDVPHLFERFFTGDKTRTEKSTGLGLAITKQLVEQMGHEISASLKDKELSIEIKWLTSIKSDTKLN
ncbi:HAMP domain-containing histidine kinase [Clostridium sp. YIM B02515]|uniref:histidine kinase n=1 Tax=Clostridium rhizosphaerae TaxID=2803861 RepID=A0ABS1T4X4_9CLOT|nr:HAMP domain-containing sensor histidine kinase [Clostridium rhizosphaerae]MBL4934379.1 HAMP domain-containing histidine kinase [Clostridium rhizosphaerae]